MTSSTKTTDSLEGKKLVYIETFNPCCDYNPDQERSYKSQDALLEDKAKVAILWFVDKDQPNSEIYGDDWDDAPSCCNSGSPYERTCKGLVKIELHLGESLIAVGDKR